MFGSFITGYARNPSLKQQLSSYITLGFAFSEIRGFFCLIEAFLIFCLVKEPSPSPIRRPFCCVLSALLCYFSYTSLDSLGKAVGSRFDRRKTNKYYISNILKKLLMEDIIPIIFKNVIHKPFAKKVQIYA